MFETFRPEELRALLADGPGPRLSIYLPTHRRHPEWKQDPLRFRALVQQAEELLGTRYKTRDTKAFLEPLRRLEGVPHWEYSLDGLALFHSEGGTSAYRLPMPVPELVVVADTYHTKPLIRFLHSNRRYRVLAVSQKAVTLYEGSPFGLGPVDLRGVPQSLRDALGVPETERSFSAAEAWVKGSIFTGAGPGKERRKEELARYFHAIDRGLNEFYREDRVPLMLAAVKYYHPIFHHVSHYPDLLDQGLEGSYERLGADRIHAESWPIVQRLFESRIEDWVTRFRERSGVAMVSDRLDDVAVAAVTGRVRCLLVVEEEPVWGILDRKTGAVTLHDKQSGIEDADVLDDIAEESLKRGAEVYIVPRRSMPTSSPIAAIYRF